MKLINETSSFFFLRGRLRGINYENIQYTKIMVCLSSFSILHLIHATPVAASSKQKKESTFDEVLSGHYVR